MSESTTTQTGTAVRLDDMPVPTTEELNRRLAALDTKLAAMSEEEAAAYEARVTERMRANGFAVGTAAEFLNLTPAESAHIEIRLSLARLLRQCREAAQMTQEELAQQIGSSQSRIAKAERGMSNVSLDLLVRGILATGADSSDIAQALQ